MKNYYKAVHIFLFLLLILCVPSNYTTAGTEIYDYDSAGRLTKVTYGDGSSIAYTYDNNGNILTIQRANAEPTLINLSSFTASPEAKKIILAWQTASENDNAGFNLYRAETEDGEYIQINEALIPAEGSPTEGASYSFVDNDVKNRKTYYYKLEDIDLNGKSTKHGPVNATPKLLYWLWKMWK